MEQLNKSLIVNTPLSRKVIALHDKGYDLDFMVTKDNRILCLQDNRKFTIDQVTIEMVELGFDKITKSFKYVHTVESCCGDKGLIVENCICVNAILTSLFYNKQLSISA